MAHIHTDLVVISTKVISIKYRDLIIISIKHTDLVIISIKHRDLVLIATNHSNMRKWSHSVIVNELKFLINNLFGLEDKAISTETHQKYQ